MNYTLSILCVVSVTLMSSMCICAQIIPDDDDVCPPWFFYNRAMKTCECFRSHSTDQIIKCAEKEAFLKLGYCMTYEEGGGFYVGICDNVHISNTTDDNYIRLPSNVSDLNNYMCGPMNRKGMMCSECADGFGLAVFSIEQVCANCTGVWYGVPLYLFIVFVPVTVFYFVIIFFHINVTSSPMVAFVFYSQVAVSTFYMVSNKLIFSTTIVYKFLKVLLSLYGIWNLDFFTLIIPPFCVSSNIKPIHAIFLNFVSAVYPVCLIVLSWLCINLYSRNSKPVVWLWDKLPHNFQRCFVGNCHSTRTIVDVFASFFLLSYAKLVYTSLKTFYYRISLHAYNASVEQSFHVKLDPSMTYFGTQHLPFAIISLLIFLLAVLPIPILLAVYPISCIRTTLFMCPIGSRAVTAINIFVQKFYSCYRDGTNGGKDMRSLVSLYFFLRLLAYALSVYQIPSSVGLSMLVFIYTACSMLIALAQPYREPYMNIIDALILADVAIITLILSHLNGKLSDVFITFFYISGSILASLPLLGMTGILIYKMIMKMRNLECCETILLLCQQDGHRIAGGNSYDQLSLESRDDCESLEYEV